MIIRSQAPWTRKKGLPSELILSTRLRGACLTHFRCSRSLRTMDKLITNHAYLFIKQGLGEIQRGNAVFSSFHLQSVIKWSAAARLQERSLVSAFLLLQTDLFSKGHFHPHAGSAHPSSALQVLTGCLRLWASPFASPCLSVLLCKVGSCTSGCRGVPETNEAGDGCSVAVPGSGQ